MSVAPLQRAMNTLDETLDLFCDAWNRHDAGELAALWTEDGVLNHPWGTRAAGRPAIRELLEEEHARSMADSRLRVVRVNAFSTGPNVLADVEGVLEGVTAPNGRRYELPHVISAMFVETDAGWRIRTMTPVPGGV